MNQNVLNHPRMGPSSRGRSLGYMQQSSCFGFEDHQS